MNIDTYYKIVIMNIYYIDYPVICLILPYRFGGGGHWMCASIVCSYNIMMCAMNLVATTNVWIPQFRVKAILYYCHDELPSGDDRYIESHIIRYTYTSFHKGRTSSCSLREGHFFEQLIKSDKNHRYRMNI